MSSIELGQLSVVEGRPLSGSTFAAIGGAVTAAWTPLQLPNLVAWYDASDTNSIIQSGGLVSQWNDKSGNSRHVTQSTGALQPTTGVDTINALNVIKFSAHCLGRSATTITQPLTMLVVAKRSSSTGGINSQIVANATNPEPTLYIAPANDWEMYDNNNVGSGTSAANTLAHQFVAVFNSASSNLWLDQAQIIANGNLFGTSRTDIFLGADAVGGTPWIGDIAEAAFMSSVISAGDRTNWNTYCAKWGL